MKRDRMADWSSSWSRRDMADTGVEVDEVGGEYSKLQTTSVVLSKSFFWVVGRSYE